MKSIKMINGLKELDVREQSEINGGESLWHQVGYFLGQGVRFIEGALENPPSMPSAAEYK